MAEVRDFERRGLPLLQQLSAALGRGGLYDWVLQTSGVTIERPAMTILITIAAEGQAMRVGAIAARMHVEGPHVTRHVNSLEKRRLVSRVVDPADARGRLIAITPEGQEVIDRYLGTVSGLFEDVLSDWTSRERNAFLDSLERLVVGLEDQLRRLDLPPT